LTVGEDVAKALELGVFFRCSPGSPDTGGGREFPSSPLPAGFLCEIRVEVAHEGAHLPGVAEGRQNMVVLWRAPSYVELASLAHHFAGLEDADCA